MRFVREPSEAEVDELTRMTRQEVGRVAMRAHLVLLSARGYTVPEIVKIHDTSNTTVYEWLDRFDAQGPEGLYDRPRAGRPPKVTDEVKETLEEALDDPPADQGYTFSVWTAALLREYIESELGVTVCEDTVRRTLHDLGFRWRRPRWAVEREDPRAAQMMVAIAKAIWNADATTVVLIEDETKFRTLPPLRSMWMRKGQQSRIPTPEQNGRFYSYGALDLDSGAWFDRFSEKANSDATIAYLSAVLETYAEQHVLLIWDQATYHTSGKVQRWIENQDRLTMLFLPRYSPELNPVEHIWRVVKQRVASNLTRAIEALKVAYRAFFKEQDAQSLLQTAGLIA
jgi:transposase